jgi:hypothetical protein
MAILCQMSSAIYIKPTFKISQLLIDTDKDWKGKGISNLKHIAEGMAKGDTAFFNGTRLIRIIPGPIGSMLTTHDFGNDPTWSY